MRITLLTLRMEREKCVVSNCQALISSLSVTSLDKLEPMLMRLGITVSKEELVRQCYAQIRVSNQVIADITYEIERSLSSRTTIPRTDL